MQAPRYVLGLLRQPYPGLGQVLGKQAPVWAMRGGRHCALVWVVDLEVHGPPVQLVVLPCTVQACGSHFVAAMFMWPAM